MQYLIKILSILIGLCVLGSCKESSEEDIVLTPEYKKVLVLFEPDSWGDDGYNDLIYKGLLNYIKGKPSDVKVNYYNPASMEVAEKMVEEWKLDTLTSKQRLLVLASPLYKELLLRKFGDDTLNTKSRNILLFESDEVDIEGVSTFSFCMYGVSYIAGAWVGEHRMVPLIAKAFCSDSITSYEKGFKDGYEDYYNGSESFDFVYDYLSDSENGYNMEDSAYVMMYEWTKLSNFVFPIIGRSVSGVYRYLREYDYGYLTVGVDSDQNEYCRVIGNMIKSVDVVLVDYLKRWGAGDPLPKKATFDMQSGYVYWLESSTVVNKVSDELKDIAMKKEEEYESSR